MSAGKVQELGNKAEFEAFLARDADKLHVVDFNATWCGPCRQMKPIFEKMSAEFPDVVFGAADVDVIGDEINSRYDISSIPAFKLLRNGEVVADIVGANPGGLKAAINQHKNWALSLLALISFSF